MANVKLFDKFVLGLLLAVFAGVVFHAPISVFLGSFFGEYSLVIKAWKEVLLAVASVLLAIKITRQKYWRELFSSRVIRLCFIYMAIHLLSLFVYWHGTQQAAAGLVIDLRFVLAFVVFYAAIKLYPSFYRPLLIGGAVAAAVSMLFTFLQVTVLPADFLKHLGYSKETITPYSTIDQNPDYVRINGTLRGPNPLGVYAGLVLVVIFTYLPELFGRARRIGNKLLAAFLALAAFFALWFSYSRSAILMTLAALTIVFIFQYGKKIHKYVWLGLAAGGLLLLGGLYLARDSHFVSHVILHEDPNEAGQINSNDGHYESLTQGFGLMLSQPLGAGVGSTGSPSLLSGGELIIENYYLYVAHEVGWAGLAAFLVLCAAILAGLFRRHREKLHLALFAGGIGALLACLVLPVWADDTVSIVWFALCGMALATKERFVYERKN